MHCLVNSVEPNLLRGLSDVLVLVKRIESSSEKNRDQRMSKCRYCKKSAKRRCSGCQRAWYCNRTCQKADWKKHKLDCCRCSFHDAVREQTYERNHSLHEIALWETDSVRAKERMELEIKRGVPVDIRTRSGETPLFSAIHHGHRITMENLLDLRADVNAKTNDGMTPLLQVVSCHPGCDEMVALLLSRQADVHTRMPENAFRYAGWTALEIAKKKINDAWLTNSGHHRIVHLLSDVESIAAAPKAPPSPNPFARVL